MACDGELFCFKTERTEASPSCDGELFCYKT